MGTRVDEFEYSNSSPIDLASACFYVDILPEYTAIYLRVLTWTLDIEHVYTDRQTDRKTDSQTDRQTDRQTDNIYIYIYIYIYIAIYCYIHVLQ